MIPMRLRNQVNKAWPTLAGQRCMIRPVARERAVIIAVDEQITAREQLRLEWAAGTIATTTSS